MPVPSSNILQQALTAIRCTVIQYRRAATRVLNDVGQWKTTHEQPMDIYGSFQPVSKKMYEAYGLDLQKSYFMFYSLTHIIDIRRNVSNDQIQFNGETFQCESNTDWYSIDGWDAVLCCKLDVPIVAEDVFGFGNANDNFTNGNFYNG